VTALILDVLPGDGAAGGEKGFEALYIGWGRGYGVGLT